MLVWSPNPSTHVALMTQDEMRRCVCHVMDMEACLLWNGPIPVTAVDQEWNKSNSKYSKYHRSADCIPAAGSSLHPTDLILTAVLWRREDEK